jgi:acyl carrier protein
MRECYPKPRPLEGVTVSATIAERVIAVVAKSRKVPPESISLDATFEELGMDSLDGINLIFDLENEFDIAIPDEDAHVIRDVRQAVDSLQKLLYSSAGETGTGGMS